MHISSLNFAPYLLLGVTLFVRVLHLADSALRLLSVSLLVCLSVAVLHFHKRLIHQWQQLPLLMFGRLEVVYLIILRKTEEGRQRENSLITGLFGKLLDM